AARRSWRDRAHTRSHGHPRRTPWVPPLRSLPNRCTFEHRLRLSVSEPSQPPCSKPRASLSRACLTGLSAAPNFCFGRRAATGLALRAETSASHGYQIQASGHRLRHRSWLASVVANLLGSFLVEGEVRFRHTMHETVVTMEWLIPVHLKLRQTSQ